MHRLLHPLVFAAAAFVAAPAFAQHPAGGRVSGVEEFGDELSPALRARIDAEAQRNVTALTRAGAIDQPKTLVITAAGLQWPLKPIAAFDQFGYHGVSNFVDHDLRYPGLVQDYACGTRTYDLDTGYNHAGTDYFLWPFPWLMMDQAQIQIVAAASGTIIGKADGNFDRSCAIANSSNPNYVMIRHDDGTTALYLHMRSGSVTPLPVGTRIAAGDYLGTVGSSGSSSGPHLHFELRDAGNNVIDPRHGTCNDAPDLWAVLQPYEDPHIDTLSTHSAEPITLACGVDGSGAAVEEKPSYQSNFAPGDTFWVFASYRDQRNGEVTNFSIVRPDGSTFASWDFDLASENLNRPYYPGTTWDWKYTLPADAPSGTWQVRATFQGLSYARNFSVAASGGGGSVGFDAASALQAREQIGAQATRCRPGVGSPPPGCTP